MTNFVLASFFLYVTVFAISQQVVGRISHASNIPRSDSVEFQITRSLGLIFVTIGFLTMSGEEQDSFLVLRCIGILVVIAGIYLSMWAQLTLGKNWVGGIALHKGHKLITNGPYRLVRHPLYTGMLLSGIGLCLVSLNLFYGLGCILYSGSYAFRAPLEEKLLQTKFKSYTRYKETTGMIFPTFKKGS